MTAGEAVVITGLGFVTSIGTSTSQVLENLRQGRHGFATVALRPGLDLPIKIAGTVEGYTFPSPESREWIFPSHCAISPDEASALPPHGVYAIDAVEQAIAQSQLSPSDLRDPTTGLYAASGGSPFLLRHHLSSYEERGWRRGHPLGVVRSISGTLNFNLVARYGIRGASCGFVSACASSSHALGFAHDEIALGRQDRMLVVGAEECLVENVIPFDAMRALTPSDDPEKACRPFDQKRDGFVVTGGAVAMVLERASLSTAPALARMKGWGQASDGYHVASPEPEGRGLQPSMSRALHATKTAPLDVALVNAHATSTQAGDRAEALALQKVFSSDKEGATPAVVSTKGLTGHGLSLAGVMEAAFTVLSLQHGFIPRNRNLTEPDPACEGLDYPTTLQADIWPEIALNNSSGFGGANVTHVFAKS